MTVKSEGSIGWSPQIYEIILRYTWNDACLNIKKNRRVESEEIYTIWFRQDLLSLLEEIKITLKKTPQKVVLVVFLYYLAIETLKYIEII